MTLDRRPTYTVLLTLTVRASRTGPDTLLNCGTSAVTVRAGTDWPLSDDRGVCSLAGEGLKTSRLDSN